MSEQYQGTPGNVTADLFVGISGVTAGPNSSVTTLAPHGFSTGDSVAISGVVGITGVNNSFVGLIGASNYVGVPWDITVTSSTQFTINNGSTTGSYSGGGIATDLFLNPEITIPADGDSLNAASVNNAFQALADRTQFLSQSLGLVGWALFTSGSDNVWVCPPGVQYAMVVGWGGGGGAAPGASIGQQGTVSGGSIACAPYGGGGAGAPLVSTTVQLVPGDTYVIAIGAGGSEYSDGSATTMVAPGPATLLTCPGGAGAPVNYNGNTLSITNTTPIASSTPAGICMPGATGPAPSGIPPWATIATAHANVSTGIGSGSNAINAAPTATGSGGSVLLEVGPFGGNAYFGGLAGVDGPFGAQTPGGTPGTVGAYSNNGAYAAFGGYGGAGGGGGPGGAGGNGANGGNALAGGTGANGSNGQSAAVNTGAGGGGGGSGGGGTTPGNGGVGGSGGSGCFLMVWTSGISF